MAICFPVGKTRGDERWEGQHTHCFKGENRFKNTALWSMHFNTVLKTLVLQLQHREIISIHFCNRMEVGFVSATHIK